MLTGDYNDGASDDNKNYLKIIVLVSDDDNGDVINVTAQC